MKKANIFKKIHTVTEEEYVFMTKHIKIFYKLNFWEESISYRKRKKLKGNKAIEKRTYHIKDNNEK